MSTCKTMLRCKLSEWLTPHSGAVPWQAAQETALLDVFLEEVKAVGTYTSPGLDLPHQSTTALPRAPSRITIGGDNSRLGLAFRSSKRVQNLQVCAQLGWPGSVVLHGRYV